MRGFPKNIGTLEDLKNLKGEFPQEVKAYVEGMIEARMEWFAVGDVKSVEAGKTDATHKVVENKPMMEDGESTFTQYELKDSKAATLYSFFGSAEEAKEFIK